MTEQAMPIPMKKFFFNVTASKSSITKFAIKATCMTQAEAYAKDIVSNEWLEIQCPSSDLNYMVDSVVEVGEYKPKYIVNPQGNYFVLENFDIDITKAKCYSCPDMDSMHAVLKMVFNKDKDEVEGTEIYLTKHDTYKFQYACDVDMEVFETTDIEDYIKNFSM